MLDIAPRMDASDWLKLLGENWTGCDNIGRHIDGLHKSPLAHNDKTAFEMMDDEEQAAFNNLPDCLTVYRGCYPLNKWGYSWTPSETIAKSFPFLNRYRQQGLPILVKALVKKENIKAIKLDREELEVITWKPKHLSTKRIKQL